MAILCTGRHRGRLSCRGGCCYNRQVLSSVPCARPQWSSRCVLAHASVEEEQTLLKRGAGKTSGKAEAAIQELGKEQEIESRSEQFFLFVAGALIFGIGVYAWKGGPAAEEYVAGYLLEQSLSIDNLFVFILCFNFFKTPKEYQDKVLSWGIYSAAIMRGVMILAGVELVENFKPLLLVFSAILLYSSYNIIFEGEDEEQEDLSSNIVVKAMNKLFTVTDTYRGDNFFVREDGVFKITPLFVVLAVIEISDLIFAVDSIPAVFGVTLDPFIIYTSNIWAILSLRALFGFVATVISELRYLDKAVAVVLAFIAGKMILDQVPGGVHISTTMSLAFVASALGVGTAASLLIPEAKEGENEA